MKASDLNKKTIEANRKTKNAKSKESRKENRKHRAALLDARKPYMGSVLRQLVDAAERGQKSIVFRGRKHVDENAFSTDHKSIEVLRVSAEAMARKLRRDGYSVKVKQAYYSGDNDGMPVNCTTWYELTISWGD